jgi:hypothetical protein
MNKRDSSHAISFVLRNMNDQRYRHHDTSTWMRTDDPTLRVQSGVRRAKRLPWPVLLSFTIQILIVMQSLKPRLGSSGGPFRASGPRTTTTGDNDRYRQPTMDRPAILGVNR